MCFFLNSYDFYLNLKGGFKSEETGGFYSKINIPNHYPEHNVLISVELMALSMYGQTRSILLTSRHYDPEQKI